uniref:Uncharacterized protein n=1 Tax=Molossus molossus TaxID=27622 RepID=A0A7J8FSB3_MOLMO|nr:hypothetical protein HJG59_008445 [Molossus molossus]
MEGPGAQGASVGNYKPRRAHAGSAVSPGPLHHAGTAPATFWSIHSPRGAAANTANPLSGLLAFPPAGVSAAKLHHVNRALCSVGRLSLAAPGHHVKVLSCTLGGCRTLGRTKNSADTHASQEGTWLLCQQEAHFGGQWGALSQ